MQSTSGQQLRAFLPCRGIDMAGSTARRSRPHMRPMEPRVVARLPVTYTPRTLGLGMKPETGRYYK